MTSILTQQLRPRRFLMMLLAAAMLGVLVTLGACERSPNPQLLQAHHGVWTDENGVPGNRICFWTVTSSHTGPVTVVEGRVRVKDFLKRAAADGVWNFENWEPLRLNVVFQDGAWVAAVKPLGRDHLLIRFSKAVADLSTDDWFTHPDTLRLKRVADEPYPPKEPGKLRF